jgi:hypothetical protein
MLCLSSCALHWSIIPLIRKTEINVLDLKLNHQSYILLDNFILPLAKSLVSITKDITPYPKLKSTPSYAIFRSAA